MNGKEALNSLRCLRDGLPATDFDRRRRLREIIDAIDDAFAAADAMIAEAAADQVRAVSLERRRHDLETAALRRQNERLVDDMVRRVATAPVIVHLPAHEAG